MRTWILNEAREGAAGEVALLDNAEWLDPHGGVFDEADQASLWAFARGRQAGVMLGGREVPRPRMVLR